MSFLLILESESERACDLSKAKGVPFPLPCPYYAEPILKSSAATGRKEGRKSVSRKWNKGFAAPACACLCVHCVMPPPHHLSHRGCLWLSVLRKSQNLARLQHLFLHWLISWSSFSWLFNFSVAPFPRLKLHSFVFHIEFVKSAQTVPGAGRL